MRRSGRGARRLRCPGPPAEPGAPAPRSARRRRRSIPSGPATATAGGRADAVPPAVPRTIALIPRDRRRGAARTTAPATAPAGDGRSVAAHAPASGHLAASPAASSRRPSGMAGPKAGNKAGSGRIRASATGDHVAVDPTDGKCRDRGPGVSIAGNCNSQGAPTGRGGEGQGPQIYPQMFTEYFELLLIQADA
jgi:hypothetical protein